MESEIIDTDQAFGAQEVEYAGFWLRFVAAIIDAIVMGIVNLILIQPALKIFGIAYPSMDQEKFRDWLERLKEGDSFKFNDYFNVMGVTIADMAISALIGILVTWFYFAVMETSAKQGTLGKMALKLKVTDMDGERITFGRATGRFFGKYLSQFTLLIGYMMAGWTEKKQALHDIVAKTLVVKNSSNSI